MAIEVKCLKCNQPLNEKGALLISPPEKEGRVDKVLKAHICCDCYKKIIMYIATDPVLEDN